MIVKICGITEQEDADAAVEGGANAIGFNFYPPSPRYIAPERAAEIRTPGGVRRVGVFVNETCARVEEIARIARLTVAQLHGDETVEEYPNGITVWKAVRITEHPAHQRWSALRHQSLAGTGLGVTEGFTLQKWLAALSQVQMDPVHRKYGFDISKFLGGPAEALLLDGPAGALYGGAGQAFDWAILQNMPRVRTILAGGLDGSNVADAVALAHPWGVDACSRIESAPGKRIIRRCSSF